jgi:hypothetical protein
MMHPKESWVAKWQRIGECVLFRFRYEKSGGVSRGSKIL